MEVEQCLEDFFNEDIPDEKTSIREICIKNPLEKYDFNEDYCILLYEQFKNKHYENFKKCLIIMIKNEKNLTIFNTNYLNLKVFSPRPELYYCQKL